MLLPRKDAAMRAMLAADADSARDEHDARRVAFCPLMPAAFC